MMNYISENVAVAGQSGVIERRSFYQVFISLSLLFIPVLALYFFSGMNAQQEYKMQVLRSEVISIAKENRLAYFEALEAYAVDKNLQPFADMIAKLEEKQLDRYIAMIDCHLY